MFKEKKNMTYFISPWRHSCCTKEILEYLLTDQGLRSTQGDIK